MRSLFLLLVMTLPSLLAAQTESLWEKHQFVSPEADSVLLPYRLLAPMQLPETSEETVPLVIFLHGSGERGDDNSAQLKHIAEYWEDSVIRADHPAYVVFPQLAAGHFWSSGRYDRETPAYAFNYQASPHMAALMHLIDSLEAAYPIDPDRIYLGGLSLGGFGTWDALARYPHRFAAGFPICGVADVRSAPLMADLPIWIFHGDADVVVPVQFSRDMHTALRALGAPVIYTEFAGVNHDSWNPAFASRHLIDWLFAQRRP